MREREHGNPFIADDDRVRRFLMPHVRVGLVLRGLLRQGEVLPFVANEAGQVEVAILCTSPEGLLPKPHRGLGRGQSRPFVDH